MLKNMNKQELKPRLQEDKPKSQEHSTQRFSFPTFLISQIQLNTQNFIPNISLKLVNKNLTKSTTKHLNHPKSTTKQHITNQTKKTQPLYFHKFQPKSSNHRSQQTPEADLHLKLIFKEIQKTQMLLIVFFVSRPHGFHDQNLKDNPRIRSKCGFHDQNLK